MSPNGIWTMIFEHLGSRKLTEEHLLPYITFLKRIIQNRSEWHSGLRRPSKASKLYLRTKVKDPKLRKKLTPSYQIGCKRINISDDYYESLQRPNSDLVTEPILSISSTGVMTTDGKKHECDTIIFGTGFVTTKYLQPMKIYGSQGKELTEQWAGSAESYLGISVAGFPNYFLLLGPNTGLGHNSVVFMIEAQIELSLIHISEPTRPY